MQNMQNMQKYAKIQRFNNIAKIALKIDLQKFWTINNNKTLNALTINMHLTYK